MQTAAVFSAPVRGIVYINGRFAGESSPDSPLITPISPDSMLYAEFKPLDGLYIPCACAVKITRGSAVECSPGAYMMSWPGNVIEIEFAPRHAYPPESEFGAVDSIPCAIIRGEGAMLRISGNLLAVPKGAALPDTHILAACHVFMGDIPGGRYLACFSKDGMAPLDMIQAGRISREDDRIFRCMTDLDDIAGHMKSCAWEITEHGPEMISGEILWSPGAPRWPSDAQSAAIAACQAAILGLSDEAEAYLVLRQRGQDVLADICKNASGCVPVPYSPPGDYSAVALTETVSQNHARARAVYYRAHPDGGPQGLWNIEFITSEE